MERYCFENKLLWRKFVLVRFLVKAVYNKPLTRN